jgi:proteasome lid subunit RPN8/RPN11
MYLFPINQIEQILTFAQAAFPRESAGLLLQEEFKRFTVLSVAATPIKENTLLSFRIREAAIDKIAESLRGSGMIICGCFHSHVIGAASPSRHDNAATKKPGDLWLIYSVRFRNLNLFEWNGSIFHRERFRVVMPLITPSSLAFFHYIPRVNACLRVHNSAS